MMKMPVGLKPVTCGLIMSAPVKLEQLMNDMLHDQVLKPGFAV